jgi:lipopolysaccharide transport system permease protein
MLLERELAAPPAEESHTESDRPAELWVIEPRGAGLTSRAQEVWRYRYLLRHFGVQALQRTYRRTVLGWLWLFLRPLGPIVIGTLVFGRLLNVPSDSVPYFLFFLVGTASWNLFEHSLLWATRSIERNRRLMRKLYFPRIILPIASVVPALSQFLIYLGLILGSVVYYFFVEGKLYLMLRPQLLLALTSAVLAVVFALALGLWTSILAAQARDVRFTLRYVLQFWLYLTPVIYPLSAIPQRLHWLVSLNPMAALVETFKWGILGVGQFKPYSLVTAMAIICLTVASGLWFFHSAETTSVDRL